MKVQLDGDWHRHLSTPPRGSEALGTVQNGLGQTGALIRYANGLYVLMAEDVLYGLDQSKVRDILAALGKMLIVLRGGQSHDGQLMEVADSAQHVDVPLVVGRKETAVRYFMTFEEQDGRRIFRPTSSGLPGSPNRN